MDLSGAICDKYAKLDSRVRVFHKENGGGTSARRLGVEESKGECISYVDSDDNLFPQSLSILIKNITSDDIDIIVSDIKDGSIISGYEFVKYRLQWGVQASIWGRLYRKELFDKTSFDVSRKLLVGEDFFMNLRVGLKVRFVKWISESCIIIIKIPIQSLVQELYC